MNPTNLALALAYVCYVDPQQDNTANEFPTPKIAGAVAKLKKFHAARSKQLVGDVKGHAVKMPKPRNRLMTKASKCEDKMTVSSLPPDEDGHRMIYARGAHQCAGTRMQANGGRLAKKHQM